MSSRIPSVNRRTKRLRPYIPNFDDPRVQRRLCQALGWCRIFLSPDSAAAWHVSALEKAFGTGSSKLCHYLRGKLLVPVRTAYAYRSAGGRLIVRNENDHDDFFEAVGEEGEFLDAGSCKTYRRNETGFIELLSKVKPGFSPTYHKDGHPGSGEYRLSPTQVSPPKKTMSELLELADALGLELVKGRHGEEIETGRFTYSTTASGRLSHGLQVVRRKGKPFLWRNLGYTYDYDIATCAPTLLLQYARRTGFNKPVPEYDAYLLDRRAYRRALAGLLGVTPEVSKVVITALFNGAKLSCNPRDSLMKLLAKAAEKEEKEGRATFRPGDVVRKLQGIDFVHLLKADIARMWTHLRDHDYPNQPLINIHRPSTNPDFSPPPPNRAHAAPTQYRLSPTQVSERQVWYQRKKSLTGSQRWAIYLRLETEVLRAVRPVLEQHGRVFLEHDGWRTDFDIDPGVLSDVIHQRTGYIVTIDKEILQ